MEIVFPRRRGPLSCLLNLRHQWTTVRTEDGGRYRRCQRCGKDETDLFGGTQVRARVRRRPTRNRLGHSIGGTGL
jgi:hypothetical protein